jgi:hypothetical protein
VPSGCWQLTGGVAAELVPALAADAIVGLGSLVLMLAHAPSKTQPASASRFKFFDMHAPIPTLLTPR